MAQYNKHFRDARRLEIVMASIVAERQILSSSAAAAQAARQGRMISTLEIFAKRDELDRDIEDLDVSINYYRNASKSMQRLWEICEVEIQNLEHDIARLRNRLNAF